MRRELLLCRRIFSLRDGLGGCGVDWDDPLERKKMGKRGFFFSQVSLLFGVFELHLRRWCLWELYAANLFARYIKCASFAFLNVLFVSWRCIYLSFNIAWPRDRTARTWKPELLDFLSNITYVGIRIRIKIHIYPYYKEFQGLLAKMRGIFLSPSRSDLTSLRVHT